MSMMPKFAKKPPGKGMAPGKKAMPKPPGRAMGKGKKPFGGKDAC